MNKQKDNGANARADVRVALIDGQWQAVGDANERGSGRRFAAVAVLHDIGDGGVGDMDGSQR